MLKILQRNITDVEPCNTYSKTNNIDVYSRSLPVLNFNLKIIFRTFIFLHNTCLFRMVLEMCALRLHTENVGSSRWHIFRLRSMVRSNILQCIPASFYIRRYCQCSEKELRLFYYRGENNS